MRQTHQPLSNQVSGQLLVALILQLGRPVVPLTAQATFLKQRLQKAELKEKTKKSQAGGDRRTAEVRIAIKDKIESIQKALD